MEKLDLHNELQKLIDIDEKCRNKNRKSLDVFQIQELSDRQKQVLSLIAENPNIRIVDIAQLLSISHGRVRQILVKLCRRRRIEMPFSKPPLYGWTPKSEYIKGGFR